jgi:hypothetical protein
LNKVLFGFLKGGKMAHSKNHKMTCPRCGSANVYCIGGKVKKFDHRISAQYIFACRGKCRLQKTRTMFSQYKKGIKIHGLSCPFCGSGRKYHHFDVNWKELTLSRSSEEMNRQAKKKKHRNGRNGNGNHVKRKHKALR